MRLMNCSANVTEVSKDELMTFECVKHGINLQQVQALCSFAKKTVAAHWKEISLRRLTEVLQ